MQESVDCATARLLAALGNEHRLRLVELLAAGERCVCQLTPEFPLDTSVVSRHLAILEAVGAIVARRQGRWTHYRIADRRVLRLVAMARQIAEKRTNRLIKQNIKRVE